MQILDLPVEQSQFLQDETGNYINSYLISTKPNDANWKIHKNTGHEKVKTFLGRDFPIIPELIRKPVEKGGGGHVKGTRDQILKAYAEHSHGKIVKVLGPYYYNDGTDDYYYRAITKLDSSRAASALIEHGKDTWIPYAVSPHIFIKEGNDLDGWTDWEGAGLCLVIKGAYGSDSIITKMCNGPEGKCIDAIASTSKGLDETLAEIISSHISKFASTEQNMGNDNNAATSSGALATTPTGNPQTNTTVDPQRAITETQVYAGPPREIPQQAEQQQIKMSQIPESELAELRDIKESYKDEMLRTIFKTLITDDKELATEVRTYSKHDMKTVKLLKEFHETIAHRIIKATEDRIKAAEKDKETTGAEKEGGENSSRKKSRTASISGGEGLRPEPKAQENNEESRQASTATQTTTINNQA